MIMKTISRILIFLILAATASYADSIQSFTANQTNVQPGTDVNLTLDYVATKKYQLTFNAYNDSTNIELTPIFNASDLRHVSYSIPSTADYNIKLVLGLVEDGNIVDSKELVLNIGNNNSVNIFNDNSCIFYAPFKGSLVDLVSNTYFTINGSAQITDSYLDGQTNTNGGNYEVVANQIINLYNVKTISIQIKSTSTADSPAGWGEDILGEDSSYSLLRFGKNNIGRIYSHFKNKCCTGFSKGYLTDGVFHTYTLVSKEGYSYLYIDGVLQSGRTHKFDFDLRIYRVISGNTNYDGIDGFVKNLRVFNKALTNSEIITLSQED